MNFEKLKKACQARGIEEVEVYTRKQSGSNVSTFNGEVDQSQIFEETEFSVRGVYNGHIVAVYTEKDSDDEIEKIVDLLVSNGKVIESDDPYFIYGGSEKYPEIKKAENDFESYTQEDKIKLCRDIEAKIREQSSLVANTAVEISVSSSSVSIENTNGLNISRSGDQAVVVPQVFVSNGTTVKTGYDVQFLKNIKDFDMERSLKVALQRPLASIDAGFVNSGSYPVVFENTVAASLLRSFSSLFSAEAVIKKMCLLSGKLGQKVFGENITLVDDPLDERAVYQTSFDDEGVAAFTKTVVENGVLKTYLHNLKTAKMMDAESTGNGFKDRDGNIDVSVSNLYLKTNDVSFDEMIKDIKDGIFITEMQGMHAGLNPVSGQFNLQSSGFKIENGKVTSPITLFIVSGNIVDMLNNVVCISNDFEYSYGVGSGSVYVKALNISGK